MSDSNIITKMPPIIETIGAQYYAFNNPDVADFDLSKYEEKVTKTETVKSANVTENDESTVIYASGKAYKTHSQVAYVDIEVEALASDADDLAKMRGDIADESGLIQTPTTPKKPYFAYGKVVELSENNFRFDWYPKCQLIENSDEAKTREASFGEQNEKLTIRAYAFDEKGKMCKNSVNTSSSKFPKGLTEEMFFNAPVITPEDLKAIVATISTEEVQGA